MASDQPNCACLHIDFAPEDVEFENPVTGKPILGKRDRWRCKDCGSEFNRVLWHNAVVKQQQDEIERLEAEVKTYKALINDVHDLATIKKLEAENKRLTEMADKRLRTATATAHRNQKLRDDNQRLREELDEIIVAYVGTPHCRTTR